MHWYSRHDGRDDSPSMEMTSWPVLSLAVHPSLMFVREEIWGAIPLPDGREGERGRKVICSWIEVVGLVIVCFFL